MPVLIYLYLFFTGSIGGFGSSGGMSPFSLSRDMFTLTFVLFNGSLALLSLLYFTALEGGGKNATFGKRLLNIRVVDEKGDGIDMKTSFVRNLLRLLWDIPTLGTFIMIFDAILVAEGDQRIGDKVADTYVVKEYEAPPHSAGFSDGGPPFSQ